MKELGESINPTDSPNIVFFFFVFCSKQGRNYSPTHGVEDEESQ